MRHLYIESVYSLNTSVIHESRLMHLQLPARMLANSKTLQNLSLSWNRIQSLRSSTFKNTNSLTYLDLSHNIIRTIRANTFFGLSKLRVLNLESNNITGKISSWMKGETKFGNQFQYQTVSLHHCSLQYYSTATTCHALSTSDYKQ